MPVVDIAKYEFRPGSRLNIDPQKAGERIREIQERDGRVTAEAILEDAKKKRSPFHRAITWDDGEAAEKWRLKEAGHIPYCIVEVVAGEKPKPQSYFVAEVKREEEPAIPAGYYARAVVLSNEEMRQQALRAFIARLNGSREKFEDYVELTRFWAAVDEVEAELERPVLRRAA